MRLPCFGLTAPVSLSLLNTLYGLNEEEFVPKPVSIERRMLGRRMFITKALIEKYGPTPKCKGCAALNRNDTAKAHDEHCRVRIQDKIRESGTEEEQGRLMMREANIESIKSAEEREREERTVRTKCSKFIKSICICTSYYGD